MKKIYDLLFEQEERIDTPESGLKMTSKGMKARQALDSIDDQVDALILRYEASSIVEEDDLNSSLNESSLKFLFEQEDEMADADEEAEASATEVEEEPVEPSGSEQMTIDKPAEDQLIPNLDLDAFAGRTVRLIKNHRSLLRIEEAIGNRIKHFLDENYGDKFVQRYLEILESQYGITFEQFDDQRQTKDEPFSTGAFAGGTGGLGGGG